MLPLCAIGHTVMTPLSLIYQYQYTETCLKKSTHIIRNYYEEETNMDQIHKQCPKSQSYAAAISEHNYINSFASITNPLEIIPLHF